MLPSQVGGKGLLDDHQMLLPLPDEVVQVALANEQSGLGGDEAAVEQELARGHVTGEEAVDHVLAPLQVLLQLPGILPLGQQLGALLEEGGLGEEGDEDRHLIYI